MGGAGGSAVDCGNGGPLQPACLLLCSGGASGSAGGSWQQRAAGPSVKQWGCQLAARGGNPPCLRSLPPPALFAHTLQQPRQASKQPRHTPTGQPLINTCWQSRCAGWPRAASGCQSPAPSCATGGPGGAAAPGAAPAACGWASTISVDPGERLASGDAPTAPSPTTRSPPPPALTCPAAGAGPPRRAHPRRARAGRWPCSGWSGAQSGDGSPGERHHSSSSRAGQQAKQPQTPPQRRRRTSACG